MLNRTMQIGLSVVLIGMLVNSVKGVMLWEDDFEEYDNGVPTVSVPSGPPFNGAALGDNGANIDGYTQYSRGMGRPVYNNESTPPGGGDISVVGGGGGSDHAAYRNFGTTYNSGIFVITTWLRAKTQGGSHSGGVGLDVAGGDTDDVFAIRMRKQGFSWNLDGTAVDATSQSNATEGGWDLFQMTVDLDNDVVTAVIDPNNDGDFNDAGTPLMSVLPANLTLGMFGVMGNDDGGPDNVMVEWTTCDFDSSGDCGLDDINEMMAQGNLVAGVGVGTGNQYDLNSDNTIDETDITKWLALAGRANGYGNPNDPSDPNAPYLRGDTNDLDNLSPTPRTVDITDFTNFLTGFTGSGSTWEVGNFDGDSDVDITDFSAHFLPGFTAAGGGSYAAGQSVPEPSAVFLLGLGGVLLAYVCCRRTLAI